MANAVRSSLPRPTMPHFSWISSTDMIPSLWWRCSRVEHIPLGVPMHTGRRRGAVSGGKRRRSRAPAPGAPTGSEGRPRERAVVLARRDVVGPIGIEQAGERLDLVAADAELELAAAVEDHAGGLRARDAVEQRAQAPEARRLDVQLAQHERVAVGPQTAATCAVTASTSAQEWIGASKLNRASSPEQRLARRRRPAPGPRARRRETSRSPAGTARGPAGCPRASPRRRT